MPFEKINPQTDFAKMEESILEFWKKENIFYRSVAEKNDTNRYFFYDGPPFATGLPHYGHILAGTIKDVIFAAKKWKENILHILIAKINLKIRKRSVQPCVS